MNQLYQIGQHVTFKTDKGRGDGIIKEVRYFGGPVGVAYRFDGCWVAADLIECIADADALLKERAK